MKIRKFFRLNLALITLIFMLSLLGACGVEVTSTPGASPTSQPQNTPTATGSNPGPAQATTTPVATTAPLPTVTVNPTPTVAPTATAQPTATSQPETTAVPTTAPIVPTETASPTAQPEPTVPATTKAPTVKVVVPTTKAPTTQPAKSTPAVAKLPGKIVFEASTGIFVVNPDGTDLKKIANGHSPVFSPDGKRVAFISDDDSAINSVDLNGGALQYHCPTEGQYSRNIRWSPSGKYLALYSLSSEHPDAPGQMQLCDMEYKGLGALTTVYRGGEKVDQVFDWSVDGQKILWQSVSYNSAGEKAFDLWYSRPDETPRDWDVVTDREYMPELSEGRLYIDARISPTNKTVAIVGTKIFFTSTPGYTSSYDGLVLNEFEDATGLAWAPDSTALLVVGVYNGEPGMYLRYFESGKVTRLTDYIPSGYIDWTRK